MMNFIKVAHTYRFTPDKEKVEFSETKPYLFCSDWYKQLKVRALSRTDLDAYHILGGNMNDLILSTNVSRGVITRCTRKVDLGFYNISTKELVWKNTVKGVHVAIPYFDGATEADIERLLRIYPVAVYYNTRRNINKLVYCSVEDLNQVVYELITTKGWLSCVAPAYKALYTCLPKFVVKSNPREDCGLIYGEQVTVFDMFNPRGSRAVELLEYSWTRCY